MGLERIRGVVIDIVKHNDKNNVVTLFTRERGRIPLLSAAGGGSRSARMRNSRIQLLSVVEADINFHGNKNLQKLGDVAPAVVWRTIYYNPIKSTLAMFLSEFLNRYLYDSSPDPALWDFIYASLDYLDRLERGLGNFHIWFMIRFLEFAGIYPDLTDYERGDIFSLRQGILLPSTQIEKDTLSPEETAYLTTLQRINSRNMHLFRFTSAQRRQLLEKIMHYYAIHFPGMSHFKSYEIMKEIFS